eukprot:5744939-Amphidinium_carterae.1
MSSSLNMTAAAANHRSTTSKLALLFCQVGINYSIAGLKHIAEMQSERERARELRCHRQKLGLDVMAPFSLSLRLLWGMFVLWEECFQGIDKNQTTCASQCVK